MIRPPKNTQKKSVGNTNINKFRTSQKSKLWNQPGTTTSWRPNQEKHIDNNIHFKRKFLSANVNQTKNPTNPTPQHLQTQHPEILTRGRAGSHKVTEYNWVVWQQENGLRRQAATAGRSKIKHGGGREGRDGDTDSIKYKKKIPRGNHDYISYICRHRTTGLPSNTLLGNSNRTNGDGCNSNDQDNTRNMKKKIKRNIQFPEQIMQWPLGPKWGVNPLHGTTCVTRNPPSEGSLHKCTWNSKDWPNTDHRK